MYLTITETAEYLGIEEADIRALVLQGRIRAVYDGENYLINKEQFTTHLEQVEEYRKRMKAYFEESLPEDPDVNDED